MTEPDIVESPIRHRQKHQTLNETEKIAILQDLEKGMPWADVEKKHRVGHGTVVNIRKQYENTRTLDIIKNNRLGILYEISETLLNEMARRSSDGADSLTMKDLYTAYGILPDKINVIEGKTGNVNIAIATMTDLGLLD